MKFLNIIIFFYFLGCAHNPPLRDNPKENQTTIRNVLLDNRTNFRDCVKSDEELVYSKGNFSSISTSFTIKKDDKIEDIKVSDNLGKGYQECVRKVISNLRFPKNLTNGDIKMNQPLNVEVSRKNSSGSILSESDKVIQKIIAARKEKYQKCYLDDLERMNANSAVPGRINTYFNIKEDGSVHKVRFGGIISEKFASCFKSELESLRFPENDNLKEIEISQPFNFYPKR